MSPAELDTLWKSPTTKQYHRSPSSTFGTLKLYDDALAGRYGAPSGLTDYVRKARLAQYENVRAQYKAYGRNAADSANPATGVIVLDVQQRMDVAALAVDGPLPRPGRHLFGAKKKRTSCTSSTPTTPVRSSS